MRRTTVQKDRGKIEIELILFTFGPCDSKKECAWYAMKTAFLYSDDFAGFDYGSGHPLKPFRLKLAYELIKACGLLDSPDPRLIEPSMARVQDLLTWHTADYINILEAANSGEYAAGAGAYGLGPGDNPVFAGMFDWSRLIAGASLKAADLVDSGEAEVAFNISGGLHHAMAGACLGVLLCQRCCSRHQVSGGPGTKGRLYRHRRPSRRRRSGGFLQYGQGPDHFPARNGRGPLPGLGFRA